MGSSVSEVREMMRLNFWFRDLGAFLLMMVRMTMMMVILVVMKMMVQMTMMMSTNHMMTIMGG